MASISGVSGSSMTSSLYNSSNIISGLASGMDTEGMIESLVQSYQKKIDQLGQKATKIEWKQEAYRSIIAKMYSFSSKYASYTSNTNLMAVSFFNNAVRVSTLGKYADAVSASGRTNSDISLNAVHQLATATQFRTSSNLVSGEGNSIEASTGMDLNGKTTLAKLNGSLTLTYGSQTVSIYFNQVTDVKAMNDIRDKLGSNASEADVLAELINQKLSGQTISLSGGKSADATERIKVSVSNGMISFSDKSSAGNSVFISEASGNVGLGLGIDSMLTNAKTDKDKPRSFAVIMDSLTYEMDNKGYLSGKTMNMSLDGVSKTITLPKIVHDGRKYCIEDAKGKRLEYNAENYEKVLSDAVQDAFKGKVKVSNTATDGKSLQLRFDVQEGSNLVINSSVGETLGIGQIATSYLNTNKTLGELLGEDKLSALTPAVDADGNELLDKNGNKLYTFEINGVKVGNYSKNSTLAELMDGINKSDAGVKVSYSQTTKNFLFTAKDTGSDGEIKLGDGLASAMFGVDHSSMRITDLLGEDVVSRDFSFKIDGEEFNGKIESNSETMEDLLATINKALQDKGYTGYEASYDPSRGLIIKNGQNEVEVEYGDDPLGDIVKKVEAQDHSKDKLVDILGGTSIKGKEYTFTIVDGENETKFTSEFLSDAPTMNDLVKRLNDVVLKDSGYTASYSKDRGLLITDSEGKEVKVNYGDDPLGNIVKAVEVKDYSKDKLTGILGKNIVDEKGFSFEIDGQTFTGKIESNKETMGDLLKTINGALKATEGYEDYTASFSAATGELVIKDADGRDVKVKYVDSEDGESILGRIMDKYDDTFEAAENKNGYTKGQDAIFDVTVNGERMQMTRTSNSVNIDGLTFNMHETFNTKMKPADNGEDEVPDLDQNGRFQVGRLADAVTFKSSTDSDKIIDAIKSMVDDYNIMMAEIKSAYSTMPYQNSSGTFANYEPLTDSDKEGMSESAIERYEEKARQGILFGDQTLSMLYNKMNQAFSFANRADVDTLKDMGITVNYSSSAGLQAVTIDEEKLRAALDSDPDRVAGLFTKTDGIMDRMKTQLDNYARTTGEPKGILIQQAGSPLSSLSLMNNTWQSQIDNISTQIEKWQDKLSDQVDRYTKQFSRMEQLINQLNSQSSALASLMGNTSY